MDPNYRNAYHHGSNARYHLKDYKGAREDFPKAANLYKKQGNTECGKNALNRIQELEK